jgi:chromate transport protein ChrA
LGVAIIVIAVVAAAVVVMWQRLQHKTHAVDFTCPMVSLKLVTFSFSIVVCYNMILHDVA